MFCFKARGRSRVLLKGSGIVTDVDFENVHGRPFQVRYNASKETHRYSVAAALGNRRNGHASPARSNG